MPAVFVFLICRGLTWSSVNDRPLDKEKKDTRAGSLFFMVVSRPSLDLFIRPGNTIKEERREQVLVFISYGLGLYSPNIRSVDLAQEMKDKNML